MTMGNAQQAVVSLRSDQDPYALLPAFVNDARRDKDVEEISADGSSKVTAVGPRGMEVIGTMTNCDRTKFLNSAAFNGIEGSRQLLFSPEHPFLSVMLRDGERLEGQHECLSMDGCSFSMRRFGPIMRLPEFTAQGMITKGQEDFLRESFGRKNIIVAGETRSGKTHFLKALLEEVQDDVRWFAIEKNTELQQPKYGGRIQINAVTTFELAKQSSLRYNPTLVVISEINSPDSAFAYVDAALSGHFGASTIHAGSAAMVKARMKMRLTGYNVPDDYIDIACAVVVHIALRKDNTRYVTEITGM